MKVTPRALLRNPARARGVQLGMFDFNSGFDVSKQPSWSLLSLVALTLGLALACEQDTGRARGEGSLEFVALGRSRTGAPYRTRGTITVHGLNDGTVHLVSTSSEAGRREIGLAPGLYSVTLAADFGVEWLTPELQSEPGSAEPLVAVPRVVRVTSGSATVVAIRFDASRRGSSAVAAYARDQSRALPDYQDVAGSSSERVLVCRPTGDGCEQTGAVELPLPERRLLERNAR